MLHVVATTSIIGDVVSQVGGDMIQLTVLMPVGTDPHDFQPRPQDLARLNDAQIVFANGVGLEPFLSQILVGSGSSTKLVDLSLTLPLLSLPGSTGVSQDPHTWMDPNNVILWTQQIANTLSVADPINEAEYNANATAYVGKLTELDAWIRTEVAKIPENNRLLVSDHAVLGYFARAYGFTLEGSITGSFSSDAAPSAREIAVLEGDARRLGIKAIFVSELANKELADQIASDLGIKAIMIYHATLSLPDGPAKDYLSFMHYNVSAIVDALK